MKHDDTTLQAAIDAAMLEIETGTPYRSLITYESCHWHKEAPARLRLAKAFLAKLPEPEPEPDPSKGETCSVCNWTNSSLFNLGEPDVPRWVCVGCCKRMFDRQTILIDDGRSLGPVAHKAYLDAGGVGLVEKWQAAAQAVSFVVLAQAIRRMEAVPLKELADIHGTKSFSGVDLVRARLIAAARGEAVGINGLTEAEEAKTASVSGLSKTAPSTFEAHGHIWTRHTPGDPMPCEPEALVQVILERELDGRDKWKKETNPARKYYWGAENECCPIVGWRYADEPDSTDWKARAEKAEEELVTLKSSPIGILRPLAEAGPVPDGCVRVYGSHYQPEDRWPLTTWEYVRDTHFADICLPSTIKAADSYARLKAYAKAGARIRVDQGQWFDNDNWSWVYPIDCYEVHPDDLQMVPEYAPANEQPKQQVPLGPEDVMPGSAITCDTRGGWDIVSGVDLVGLSYLSGDGEIHVCWKNLIERRINRSIPLTGKWDANAWEPCYKLI